MRLSIGSITALTNDGDTTTTTKSNIALNDNFVFKLRSTMPVIDLTTTTYRDQDR